METERTIQAKGRKRAICTYRVKVQHMHTDIYTVHIEDAITGTTERHTYVHGESGVERAIERFIAATDRF